MRVCCHIADRTLYTWPAIYWAELITALLADSHDVFIFSDEKQVTTDIEHERLRKCFSFNEEEIDEVIRQCDVFIGVPLRFSTIATSHNLKIINLLGATTKGKGVISTAACTGCIDKTGNEVDCLFGDELCYWLITPTDVKKEFNRVCA